MPAKKPGDVAAERMVSGCRPETARKRPRRSSSAIMKEKAPTATFSASSRVTLFKGVFMLSVCISSIGLDLTIPSDEIYGPVKCVFGPQDNANEEDRAHR